MSFSCPLCHQPLSREKNSYICPQRHQFDMAKEGYVNLLPVQHKRSRDPGDSAEMMQARRAFLDAGHYQPLRDAIVAQLRERLDDKPPVSPGTTGNAAPNCARTSSTVRQGGNPLKLALVETSGLP